MTSPFYRLLFLALLLASPYIAVCNEPIVSISLQTSADPNPFEGKETCVVYANLDFFDESPGGGCDGANPGTLYYQLCIDNNGTCDFPNLYPYNFLATPTSGGDDFFGFEENSLGAMLNIAAQVTAPPTGFSDVHCAFMNFTTFAAPDNTKGNNAQCTNASISGQNIETFVTVYDSAIADQGAPDMIEVSCNNDSPPVCDFVGTDPVDYTMEFNERP